MKTIITSDQFCLLMEELEKLRKDTNDAHQALVVLDPEFGGLHLGRWESLAVELLKQVVGGDKYNYIEYWLYETTQESRTRALITDQNGEEIPFKTYTDLYNLLVESLE